MKKNIFSLLSDNQKYLLCVPCFFDRSRDYKVKVIKEYKHYYILENGKKISKVKGRWLSNVNNLLEYSDLCNYRNEDGSTYRDELDEEMDRIDK